MLIAIGRISATKNAVQGDQAEAVSRRRRRNGHALLIRCVDRHQGLEESSFHHQERAHDRGPDLGPRRRSGHQTALAVAEAFGTLAALYPGRIDLGLGRSGHRREAFKEAARKAVSGEAPVRKEPRVVNGLVIPPPYSFAHLVRSERSERLALQSALLQQPGAESPDFGDQVDDIMAFLAGTWRSDAGVAMEAMPGADAGAEVWILGSSAGQSARVAGTLGLPFAANYHLTPATVLEAVAAYREAFRPSAISPAPHVLVSADVVVADTDARAQELAAPYGAWVRSIRSGEGARPFASPETMASLPWTDEDRVLVADRVDTQFVGSPATVCKHLRILQDATGADELLVTTITYSHADRVRSFKLLAHEWGLP